MDTANESVGHTGVTLTKGRDASNTHGLQKALLRDFQRRLRDVRGGIRGTIIDNDALELSTNIDAEEAYDFPRTQAKAQAFMRDIRSWLRQKLLGKNTSEAQVRGGDWWLVEYLQEAYQVGASTGEGRLMQAGLGIEASGVETLLQRPIAQQQLADLYARAFENLKGVTEDAARQLRETLTAGVAEGLNPRDMAAALSEQLDSIERARLATIARTEVMQSHADAAIDVYRQHDTDVVAHTSRLTAKDTSVCAFCRALGDIPFTLAEFQTVTVSWGGQPRRIGVPAHANGRCSPMPEVGLDSDDLDPLDERIPDAAGGRPITILNT